MNDLTVTRITAQNVLKYQQFDLHEPGKLTLFRGANGEGKTSALRLLSLAVTGATNPAAVIHDGAAKGFVKIDFQNGYSLRRSFSERGQYLTLTDERGREVRSPQTEINKLVGEFRDFNPLTWLSAPAKDQIRILLQAIDVRLTEAEFKRATGVDAPFDIDFDAHGLLVLDSLRERFAEERKAENREADGKRKAAAEARKSLPAAPPVITDEQRALVATQIADAQAAAAGIEARRLASKQHATAVANLMAAIDREIGDVRELEAENNRLLAQISKNNERMRQTETRQVRLREQLEDLATSAPPTPEEIAAAHVAVEAAQAELSILAADERSIEKFAAVAKLEEDANDAAIRASILDATIKTISGELRQSLLAKASLPVDSLAIEGDVILVDGHPLEFVAESQQIRIALSIARALNPNLRVIVLDGTERLDAKRFATFLEEIARDDFQYLASEVQRDVVGMQVLMFGQTEDGEWETAVVSVGGGNDEQSAEQSREVA